MFTSQLSRVRHKVKITSAKRPQDVHLFMFKCRKVHITSIYCVPYSGLFMLVCTSIPVVLRFRHNKPNIKYVADRQNDFVFPVC